MYFLTAVQESKEMSKANMNQRGTALSRDSLDIYKMLELLLMKLLNKRKTTFCKLFHSTQAEREHALLSDIHLIKTLLEFSSRVHLKLFLTSVISTSIMTVKYKI